MARVRVTASRPAILRDKASSTSSNWFSGFKIVEVGTGIDQVRLPPCRSTSSISSMPAERIPTTSTSTRQMSTRAAATSTSSTTAARGRNRAGRGSTGYDIYLHPLAVLLNEFHLTFNAGVDQLSITDQRRRHNGYHQGGRADHHAADQDRRHDYAGDRRSDRSARPGQLHDGGRRRSSRPTEPSTSTPMMTTSTPLRPAPTITILGTIDADPVTVHGTGRQRHRDRRHRRDRLGNDGQCRRGRRHDHCRDPGAERRGWNRAAA